MKRQLNIIGPIYKYKYLIEYTKSHVITDTHDIHWCKDGENIRLLTDSTQYYRKQNDWYDRQNITSDFVSNYIPDKAYITNVKLYIPNFAAHLHTKGVKYMISFNTWVNGMKIDLGSFLFKPTDTKSIETGCIKNGNNDYFEYISMNILDPYYLMYSDDWIEFRNKVCLEPKNINSTPSSLYATIYVVNEYENRFIQNIEFAGSATNFIVADENDYFKIGLDIIQEPKLGFRFNINMNPEYDWLLTYFKETYNLDLTSNDIKFELIIKNDDSAVVGPKVTCELKNANSSPGYYFQDIYWDGNGLDAFKLFFSSWNDFEEGWYFVGSMTLINNLKENGEVYDEHEAQIFLTNDVIITQDIYSIFSNRGSEKVDMNNLIVPKYNIVNKIKHEIVPIDRPILSVNSAKGLSTLPVRIKRPDKFNIHKIYTQPLIKI